MAEAFNPYHIWLAIPPEDQPPDHYRLLGVKAFETNPDVLENAADQRMSHLRSFQSGKHSAESQKLLNELAAARLCLLNPEKRQAYDRVLKAKLAAEKPAPAPAATPVPTVKPLAAPKPLAKARPLVAQPLAAPAEPATSLDFDPLEQTPARRQAKKRGSNTSPAVYAGVGLGLVALIAVIWIALGSGGDDKPIAARNAVAPSTDRDADSKPSEHPVPVRPASVPPKASSDPRETQDDPQPAVDSAVSSPPAETPAMPDQPADDLSDEMPVAMADNPDEAGAAEPAPDDRAEPPTADQIAAAVTEIQRVLRDDYAAAKKPAEKTALAEKLLALVPDSSGASERYALLTEARRLAISANNPRLALQAADTLAENFAVDRFELLTKTADELAARDLPVAARKELVEAIEPLVEQALAAGQFAPGRRLAAVGMAAARKTNQAEIVKALTRLGKELAAGEKLASSAADARTRLEKNPDDPQANETLGKYLCLYAGDWPAGLPHLARAEDSALRAVAELETSADSSPSVAVKVGDAWWDLAEHGGADAGRMRARGGYWYQQAVGSLTGLTKTRVEKRLDEIPASQPSGGLQQSNGGGVTADKLVWWSCNNNGRKNLGMLSCNVELRAAGKVVWSKNDINLEWSPDAERATSIPLPKIAFDRLRVETAKYHDGGSALCEIEVFSHETNLARGKPVAASGSWEGHSPAAVVDGIRDSSQWRVGYWAGPLHQLAWLEVQFAPWSASGGKTVYLSDLSPIEAHLEPGRPLSQPYTAGAASGHCLFMHAIRSGTSHAAFALDKKYQTLSGAAAISDVAVPGSATPLTFRIVGDGKELWHATLQKTGATKPVNVRVSRVTKLELFVDCPGSANSGHATWVDLKLTRAGMPTTSKGNAPEEKRLEEAASQSGEASGSAIADKLVLWNCNNHGYHSHGMLSCNVELRKAGEVVWSKKAVPVTWSKDEEPATTIALPKIAFDTLRVETATYQMWTALCEVEIFQGRENLARGKPIKVSGSWDARYPATALIDGIKNSSQEGVGYWVAPDRELGWIEAQVGAPSKPRVEQRSATNGGDRPGKIDGSVIAEKLVLWSCHNNAGKNLGMLSCNVELRAGGKLVWSKKDIHLDWSKDDEPATTIPLPKIAFDQLRVATATYHDLGSALCEVEILNGESNLARGKPVAASSSWEGHSADAVVDGIRDSSQLRVGYWAGFFHQLAWIEVQFPPQPVRSGKTVFLSDLPAIDPHVHVHFPLTRPSPVGDATSFHSLFTHPPGNGPAHVAYLLDKKYKSISGAAAISDSAGEGSSTPLTFRIVGDGKELWKAILQKAGSPERLKLAIDGVSKLELIVDCPGGINAAHAMWLDLELTRAGSKSAGAEVRTGPPGAKPANAQ